MQLEQACSHAVRQIASEERRAAALREPHPTKMITFYTAALIAAVAISLWLPIGAVTMALLKAG